MMKVVAPTKLAVGVVLALGVPAGFAVPGQLAGAGIPTKTYTDPAGDASGAPDLTTMTVDNDSSGEIQFRFTAAMEPNMGVDILLDTDKNLATGQQSTGADYAFEIDYGSDGRTWDLYKWNGGTFVPMGSTPAYYSRNGDTFTLMVANKDLGKTTSFSFFAFSTSVDANGTIVGFDRSPDRGSWVYSLRFPVPANPAVAPWVGKAAPVPARPIAGKSFVVTFPVTRRDTGAPVMHGTASCLVLIGGKPIRHAQSLKNGRARVALTVPPTAKGKLLQISITVTAGSQSGGQALSYRIG
jgi:hypothetical protein